MAKTHTVVRGWAPNFRFPPAEAPFDLIKEFKAIRLLLAVESIDPPLNVPLEALYKRLIQIAKGKDSLSSLSKRELKCGVWLLFSSRYGDRLSDDNAFLKSILTFAWRITGNKGTISAVCAFLTDYPKDAENFELILRWLRQLTERLSGQRYVSVQRRIVSGRLLQKDGPLFVAGLISSTSNRAEMELLLEDHFLVGERATTGFILEVFRQLQSLCQKLLASRPIERSQVDRFLEFSLSNQEGENDFRFPGTRADVAHTLLNPFIGVDLPKSEREFIKDFLLEHYGDPRTQIGKWQGVSADSKQVLISWLVESTFEDFMRIVDLTQDTDNDADRQWPYRKAFWLSYLRQGFIDDAWLVLADEIEARALRYLEIKRGTYARIGGGGVRPSHAVLIIQIGDQVITEWSHMGRYRVWNLNDRSAPRLHLARYDRYSVTTSPRYEESHMGAENGRWQEKLEEYLRRHTGIRMPRSQYMAIR